MKLFVTVGFEKPPFDRLVRTVDEAVAERRIPHQAFIQVGHGLYLPKACAYERFIGFDEMIRRVNEADVIISHAGVGTLLLCRSLNKVPILFPRNPRFDEHVDSHQLAFCRRMEREKRGLVAYTEEDLIAAVLNYRALAANLPSDGAPAHRYSLNVTLARLLSTTPVWESEDS